jgi:hypothetical protein
MPYYYDPSAAVGAAYGTVNPALRKVIAYIKDYTGGITTDFLDGFAGHGTHVAGTIAGKHRSQIPGLSNGLAPDAKLYFNDIEISCYNNTALPTGCEIYD